MDDEIVKYKIEKAIDLVCQLYRRGIIMGAYIVGSVARGTARKESDIDIYLINPFFMEEVELEPLSIRQFTESELLGKEERKKLAEKWKYNIELSNILKDIGIEFRQIDRRDDNVFWYQLYKKELFHIMIADSIDTICLKDENIMITKDLCTTSYQP